MIVVGFHHVFPWRAPGGQTMLGHGMVLTLEWAGPHRSSSHFPSGSFISCQA